MRAVGIALMVGGALLICSEYANLAAPPKDKTVGRPPEGHLRIEAFFKGVPLVLIGFVLVVLSKRASAIISAVPADQWISISLTAAAADLAKRTIVENRFPPGTGLRILSAASGQGLDVKYDSADGDNDCLGEDKGVSVFVEDALAAHVTGQTIDVQNGQFVVVRSKSA